MGFKTLIGVDCATKAPNVGLARARLTAGRWRLTDVARGSAGNPPAARIAAWLEDGDPTLLALDAPLGWPSPLSQELALHTAGTAIHTPADEMFNRTTDRYVKENYRKRPLEVGADRIARTAHAALVLLEELRRSTGREIPLAWTQAETSTVAAIEVYPAVTSQVHFAASGQTASGHARTDIIALVGRTLVGHDALDLAGATRDELDAVLCVVAGIDFLAGNSASRWPGVGQARRLDLGTAVRTCEHGSLNPTHFGVVAEDVRLDRSASRDDPCDEHGAPRATGPRDRRRPHLERLRQQSLELTCVHVVLERPSCGVS
jgi:predicted RNase H-like nuclease